jgi:hypothetical protein
MTIRTTRKTVTFTRPFALNDFAGFQPAGTYEVETDEELLDNLSFPAWRRVATMIHLRKDGATQVVRVNPVELDAVLLREAGFVRPFGDLG